LPYASIATPIIRHYWDAHAAAARLAASALLFVSDVAAAAAVAASRTRQFSLA